MAIATKSKPKKLKISAAPRAKKSGISFDGWEDMTGEQYHRFVRNHRQDLYDNYKAGDLAPEVFAWMKENGYSKEDIDAAKKKGPSVVDGITCKLLRNGMPDINPKHKEFWESLPGTAGTLEPVTVFLRKSLDNTIARGRSIVEVENTDEKVTTPVVSIQDRMRETASNMAIELDEILDQLCDDPKNFETKDIKVLNILKAKEAKAAHARIIKGFFTGQKQEYEELLNPPSAAQLKKMSEREQDYAAQLKEGYSWLGKREAKKIYDFLVEIEAACDMLAKEQKVTRKPRKPKEINKEKVIAKLKYKKIDEPLKLVSINPADIIGANELWVFNTKTRKIGKYVAANIDPKGIGRAGTGLQVKGTTIIGFKEDESVQKTLRKPDEQLAAFKSAGKVALRKFLDEIKAVDIKLNGRINEDTILLKVS